jgi:hypothetical protein
MRRMFMLKIDEVTGEWTKQHEELNGLYCLMVCTAEWSVPLIQYMSGE